MAYLSGILQNRVIAVSAVAVASVSADLHEKLIPSRSLDTSSSEQLNSSCSNTLQDRNSSFVSLISDSKFANFSFVTRINVPKPEIKNLIPITFASSVPGQASSNVGFASGLINLYKSAEITRAATPASYSYSSPSSPPEELYRWHLPEVKAVDISGGSDCSTAKSKTVVVLLGWLGAKQKHLKRYAEWYTSRGFHAITFTFPMAEILSYQVGGKAELDVELLVKHLAEWMEEEHGKNLVFHTFSNTGWLTYGVMLEKFQELDSSLMERIKGCVVDSAPVAAPDPQVWASGFSAAFLKKQSVATKGLSSLNGLNAGKMDGDKITVEAKPAVTESALLVLLEKFFGVVLNLPTVNRRLSEVVEMLTSRQPSCPQLYIYSSADKVIPAESVESFIEKQRSAGREVRACNFVSTPHVDHFRNDPKLYSSQLTQFLEDCVLTCCKPPQTPSDSTS